MELIIFSCNSYTSANILSSEAKKLLFYLLHYSLVEVSIGHVLHLKVIFVKMVLYYHFMQHAVYYIAPGIETVYPNILVFALNTHQYQFETQT